MKLIRCKICNDVVRLVHTHWRMCDCGACGGQYNVDMLSATVGGDCDVVGISNIFFDDEYNSLTEKEKNKFKKKIKHPPCEIWFGGSFNDEQIFRIKSSKGPRLNAEIEWLQDASKMIVKDKRKYSGAGKYNPKIIIIKGNNIPSPSFRDKTMRKK